MLANRRLRNVAILSLLALAACAPSQSEAPVAGEQTYVIALSWQPAFCETAERRPECRSQTAGRADASRLSLHGLWPQPGSNVYCGVSPADEEASKSGRWRQITMARLSDPLWERLQSSMPGTRSNLHRHEWIKHGTCMRGADAELYFRVSVDILDGFNDSALGRLLAANIGRRLTVDAMRAALDADFGAGAGRRLRLACAEDDGRRIIRELTIGLKGDLSVPAPDRAMLGQWLQAAPPTDAGCPGGIVDPVGLQ